MTGDRSYRNISREPPPRRPVVRSGRRNLLASASVPLGARLRRILARAVLGAGEGAQVGLVTGPVLGAGSGLIYLLLMGGISGPGGWEQLIGGIVLFGIYAAPIGAWIGVVLGLLVGSGVGMVASFLPDGLPRRIGSVLLGVALGAVGGSVLSFAGVLFALAGGIGGWRVAAAVERELHSPA